MEKDSSTESKIKEAARRVFVAKGFAGCSSREIAKEAGLNVGLVNYYFRSKSQLFELIFAAAMEDFLLSMVDVFSADLSLESKVRIFIEREYEFLTKHPEMPGFIFNEMRREDGCSMDHSAIFQRIADSGVFHDCLKAQEAGDMRKIDLVSIMILIMSNCYFPFIARPLIKQIHQLSEEQYENQLKLHKQYVTEMIVSHFFPSKTK